MTRSEIMSRVRGKDTKPELIIRRGLHARGLRYRLHDKKLPGRPDIVLRRWHSVIEVRGCYWRASRLRTDAQDPSRILGPEDRW